MDYKQHFPIFSMLEKEGHPIVYLDNAATTHKPSPVLDAERNYYMFYNANVHRANHYLSQKSTEFFEETRDAVKEFIHAGKREEIIFTKGTTESINLIASSLLEIFDPGDNIILTWLEHHSNIVPWQIQAKRRGISIKVAPITDDGFIDLEALASLMDERTRLISITHVSNVLGTIQPVEKVAKLAHEQGVIVVVDGAQAMAHIPVDVQALGCDFYVFSAHKMYGPTGVGVLYGRSDLLEQMPPYQGGGEMIDRVSFDNTTYQTLPYKFEAGTPNIGGVIAFKEAVTFVKDLFKKGIEEAELRLLSLAYDELAHKHGCLIYGTGNLKNRIGVLSFNHPRCHPYDLGLLLDKMHVAVRTGHHCAQPLMQRLNAPMGTVRLSLACYNDESDIHRFVEAFDKVVKMLI